MDTTINQRFKKRMLLLCSTVVLLLSMLYFLRMLRVSNQTQWHPQDMIFLEGVPYILQEGVLYRHVQKNPGEFLRSEKEWEPVDQGEYIRQLFVHDGKLGWLREDGEIYLEEDISFETVFGDNYIPLSAGAIYTTAQSVMELNKEYAFSSMANHPVYEWNAIILKDGSLLHVRNDEWVEFDWERSAIKGRPVYAEGGYLLTDKGNLYSTVLKQEMPLDQYVKYDCVSEGENIVSFEIGVRSYLAQTADGRTLSFRYVRKYPNDRNDHTMINDPLPVSAWRNVTPYYVGSALAIGINEKGKPVIAKDEEYVWSEAQKIALEQLAAWDKLCYITFYDGAYVGMKKDGGLVSVTIEQSK